MPGRCKGDIKESLDYGEDHQLNGTFLGLSA